MIPEHPRFGETLAASTDAFESQGFVGQFSVTDDAEVLCYSCHHAEPPEKIELDALRRTEGASDPDDMTAVAAIVCPDCHTKGTLLLKYGPGSSAEEAEVLRHIDDRRAASSGGTSA